LSETVSQAFRDHSKPRVGFLLWTASDDPCVISKSGSQVSRDQSESKADFLHWTALDDRPAIVRTSLSCMTL
jgi:hypothetical protein